MGLEIVCTLTDAEMRERRQTFLNAIKDAAIQTEELNEGYAYSFKASSEVLAQLNRLVDMERQCCQFLTFRIVVQAGANPIRLEITGALEAKPIIAVLFGGSVSEAST